MQRVYTQNVDGLHTAAKLPPELIVEAHGSWAKNNIVMYGDQLPSEWTKRVVEDFPLFYEESKAVDLVLVLGTALQVAPFCALPNLVNKHCTRVLVTKNTRSCLENPYNAVHLRDDDMCSMYSVPQMCPTIKIGKRLVSLQSWWGRRKWKNEFVLDMDVNDFVHKLISGCGWEKQYFEISGKYVV